MNAVWQWHKRPMTDAPFLIQWQKYFHQMTSSSFAILTIWWWIEILLLWRGGHRGLLAVIKTSSRGKICWPLVAMVTILRQQYIWIVMQIETVITEPKLPQVLKWMPLLQIRFIAEDPAAKFNFKEEAIQDGTSKNGHWLGYLGGQPNNL